METKELRRAASWRNLEPGTVFMLERDLAGAETSPEPWRYARMVVELTDFTKGWVSFCTGYAFVVDPLYDDDEEYIVIAEPIG